MTSHKVAWVLLGFNLPFYHYRVLNEHLLITSYLNLGKSVNL